MANAGGFLAGGLADLGSQVATGLLGGQELLAREQDRRLRQAHQSWLDQLQAQRLELERQREQRLAAADKAWADYRNRPQYVGLGEGRVGIIDPSGRINFQQAPESPEKQRERLAKLSVSERDLDARNRMREEARITADALERAGQPLVARFLRMQAASPDFDAAKLTPFLQLLKTGSKAPTTADGWRARSLDPTLSPEDRAHAARVADTLEQQHIRIAREGAEGRAEVKKKEQQEKVGKQFASTYTLLNQLDTLIPAMEKKGFLSTGDDAASTALAAARRSRWIPGIGKPGDPDLTAWRAHAGTMVAILRQLGDIGPRAIAAYQSAIDVIEHPTTAAGARKALAQLRQALDAARTGQEQGGATPSTVAPSAPKASLRFNPGTGLLEAIR